MLKWLGPPSAFEGAWLQAHTSLFQGQGFTSAGPTLSSAFCASATNLVIAPWLFFCNIEICLFPPLSVVVWAALWQIIKKIWYRQVTLGFVVCVAWSFELGSIRRFLMDFGISFCSQWCISKQKQFYSTVKAGLENFLDGRRWTSENSWIWIDHFHHSAIVIIIKFYLDKAQMSSIFFIKNFRKISVCFY